MRLPSISGMGRNKSLGLIATAALLVPLGIGGCAEGPKGFIDPTATGRWKNRAIVVQVLNHLDVGVEEPNEEFALAEDMQPEDYSAEAADYRISPNDGLSVTITDLLGPGVESVKQGRVTETGKLSLPSVGQVQAAGLTEAELQNEITRAYREARLIENAQVTVTVAEAQGKAFTISGAVPREGRYVINQADFRMLDAVSLAGGAPAGSEFAYVIRQTNKPKAATRPAESAPAPAAATPGMLEPTAPGTATEPAIPAPSLELTPTPTPASTPSPAPSLEPTPAPTPGATPATQPQALIPAAPEAQLAADTTAPATTPAAPGLEPEGRVISLDGKAKEVGAPAAGTAAEAPANISASGSLASGDNAMAAPTTQDSFAFNAPGNAPRYRQIRVPLGALRNGDLRYNILVHPGDFIIIPGPQAGLYYMAGHVNRPGVYQLSGQRVNLIQAVTSAGMFDQLAVPERTEIIRRLPGDKQVFARVNLDRIFSGLDPDIYLKPNDVVNVGTTAWAPFVAAVRNAFRFTYGFGFIYDKNFNEDAYNNR